MLAWLLHGWAEAGRSNKYSTIRQFLQVFRKQRIASHFDSSFAISTEQCKFQYRLAAKDACRDNREFLQYSTQDAQPVGSFLIINRYKTKQLKASLIFLAQAAPVTSNPS